MTATATDLDLLHDLNQAYLDSVRTGDVERFRQILADDFQCSTPAGEILDKAQLQLAKENGIRVEEVQLDRALERIAENNKMTLSTFRQELEKDGVAFDKFRNEVRQQIQLQRLREREVDDRIDVSDSEIDQFLAESKGSSSARSEYNLSHVLVRVPEQASPEQIEQARKKAEQARAEAVSGADFAKIAATYSDAPDALKGGSMLARRGPVARAFRQGREKPAFRRNRPGIAQSWRLPCHQADGATRRGGGRAHPADPRAAHPGADQRSRFRD